MAPRNWFSQSEETSIQHPEQMTSAMEAHSRKSSRLSATFSDSKPWNFMTSTYSSDRSSTSSARKRLSLFGSRSSAASSADLYSLEQSSPRDSAIIQSSKPEPPSRPESRFSIDSKATVSGGSNLAGPNDSWRSSIFSRRRPIRPSRQPEMREEPRLQRIRNDIRSLSWRRSSDFDRDSDSGETLHMPARSMNISAPFNFQHVTHTQHNQLPQMGSVTDNELVSKFWEASAYQQPKNELRGIKADRIDSNYHLGSVGRSSTASSLRSDLSFPRNTDTTSDMLVHELDGSPCLTTPDLESPLDDSRSMSLGSRTHSFSRSNPPSRERLAALAAEQREAPTMVHPALRAQSSSISDGRSSSQGQVFELPGTSLESVPEEIEGYGPGPAKATRARAMLEHSPLGSPKQSPTPSPSLTNTIRHKNGLVFTPFPVGNAFAQAQGGNGAELPRNSSESRLSFSVDGNIPSLSSGESWENDIDFCYLVEAESSCDFDWVSVRSSRKGSDATRRDSTASLSGKCVSYSDRRASNKSQYDEGLFADFDGFSTFAKDQARHDSPQMSLGSHADLLTPILESPAKPFSRNHKSETVGPTRPQHTRHISLDSQASQEPALDTSARWSIASPSCLPEGAKSRGISFTTNFSKPRSVRMSFPAPALPPPQTALPPLPAQRPAKAPISPPLSPTSTWSSSFPTMRRPSSAQDRAILQAAGRFVRNGRTSSRPSTPSRLSHVQHAGRGSLSPRTPPKTTVPELKLGVRSAPTPPMSPPEQHQGFQAYPAWI